jgi:hypothetical protein
MSGIEFITQGNVVDQSSLTIPSMMTLAGVMGLA